ncbi:hypothetical protein [Bacteroides sp. 51]|uniref:hypothetical protein n=1 Tax=Bacteroides sp. 51 TaxID=2302938 RepID=UPI0013D12197|nr:hypothetical protein [Bacteroides sp. 51]
MTNNIKKLTKRFMGQDHPTLKDAKDLYILGEYDAAFKIYKTKFVELMKDQFSTLHNTYRLDDKERAEEYNNYFQKHQAAYQERLNKLGPEYQIDFSRYDSYQKMSDLHS